MRILRPTGRPVRRAVSLADFQRLIRDMYFEKDVARGIDGTFMWLMEEVGELASALRNGTHEERLGEFADVLAWLATIANVAGVDLTEAVTRKYGSGCPGCGQLRVHLCRRGEAMSRPRRILHGQFASPFADPLACRSAMAAAALRRSRRRGRRCDYRNARRRQPPSPGSSRSTPASRAISKSAIGLPSSSPRSRRRGRSTAASSWSPPTATACPAGARARGA